MEKLEECYVRYEGDPRAIDIHVVYHLRLPGQVPAFLLSYETDDDMMPAEVMGAVAFDAVKRFAPERLEGVPPGIFFETIWRPGLSSEPSRVFNLQFPSYRPRVRDVFGEVRPMFAKPQRYMLDKKALSKALQGVW